jgi:hypothetical protein
MAADEDQPDEPTGIDQIGRGVQEMADLGLRMTERNVELWRSVADHVQGGERYTADQMAGDTAAALSTAMQNMQDTWSFLSRMPGQTVAAAPLPTVFLLLEISEPFSVPEPVWVRVPFEPREKLPETAEIELSGPDDELAQELRGRLDAQLGDSGRSYAVRYQHRDGLKAGVYTGMVYLDKPVVPLADLRIVIREPGA